MKPSIDRLLDDGELHGSAWAGLEIMAGNDVAELESQNPGAHRETPAFRSGRREVDRSHRKLELRKAKQMQYVWVSETRNDQDAVGAGGLLGSLGLPLTMWFSCRHDSAVSSGVASASCRTWVNSALTLTMFQVCALSAYCLLQSAVLRSYHVLPSDPVYPSAARHLLVLKILTRQVLPKYLRFLRPASGLLGSGACLHSMAYCWSSCHSGSILEIRTGRCAPLRLSFSALVKIRKE